MLLQARKRLINIPPWVTKTARGRNDSIEAFECRVEVRGTLPRGLWFRVNQWSSYPNVATVQLECELPNTRSHLALYRFDWHPFSSHLNGPHGPPELAGLFIDAGITHEHSYLNHNGPPDTVLSPSSPLTARITDNDFQSFNDVLLYTCAILSIENGDDLPPSNVQMVLV